MASEVRRLGGLAPRWRLGVQMPAALIFALALVVQSLHQVEHTAQLLQSEVLRIRPAHGLFGSIFDLEWVHVAYNGGLYLVLLLTTVALLRGAAARPPLGWLLLGALLAVQTYHVIEHTVKIIQHVETGADPAPGILGRIFDLIWLHFSINVIVLGLMAGAFLALGLHRGLRTPRLTARGAPG